MKEMEEEVVEEMKETVKGEMEEEEENVKPPSPCQLLHVNQPGQLPRYCTILHEVIAYAMRCSYPEGHTFSEMELLWL
eukprot:12722030-Ditylum_brightwellii.AAC.1